MLRLGRQVLHGATSYEQGSTFDAPDRRSRFCLAFASPPRGRGSVSGSYKMAPMATTELMLTLPSPQIRQSFVTLTSSSPFVLVPNRFQSYFLQDESIPYQSLLLATCL